MKLIDHRQIIQNNPNAYVTDIIGDRLVGTLVNHIKDQFKDTRFTTDKKLIVKELIVLIFESQDKRPFFHVEGTELPLCWNRPADWDCDYIKYEWGHLLSKNQNPDKLNSIENLGLYSARCNQHIQSSMNIQELMVYGGLISTRISNVLTKRRALFETSKWKNLIEELRK